MFRHLLGAIICLASLYFLTQPFSLSAPSVQQISVGEPQLTPAQMKEFLRQAKVIKEKPTTKGITLPSRLTLSDGNLTHDASFQTIDESKMKMEYASGGTEFNFRDCYKYNIAAYELADLLGLGHMIPVTIERKIGDRIGSLSWWLKVQMDEADRMKKQINPPYQERWNEQMYRVRVFTQLVYDVDRNMTNILIDPDWKLYMIDFSRAFRLHRTLKTPTDLVKCDRKLLENLRKLNQQRIEQATKPYLETPAIKALLVRRDLIVARFEKLIAEKGENAVLY